MKFCSWDNTSEKEEEKNPVLEKLRMINPKAQSGNYGGWRHLKTGTGTESEEGEGERNNICIVKKTLAAPNLLGGQ